MRLAWFSPVPPVPSGVAVCTGDLVDRLRGDHTIDVYVDEPVVHLAPDVRSAHDFVWRHRRAPYDLTVYQLGNSSHHDYLWPYLFRYPGLTVLHDAHLHHARAAALLRIGRVADYRAEFAANHPDVCPDEAELAVAGLDNHRYYEWPMRRLVVARSRLTVAHSPAIAAMIEEECPSAAIETIHLGHGTRVSDADARLARAQICRDRGIPDAAVIVGVFGGLAPDKRLPEVLDAFAALLAYTPQAHLLLGGAPARHYDVAADVRARGLEARVTITGYVASDVELTALIAACDISINLRWPTAREISGPWLRALAAGRATITTDLAHLADVPSLDPRTWRPTHTASADGTLAEPVTIAVDILDEAHSLRLALRRLAADETLRQKLGAAGRSDRARAHSIEQMADGYRRAIARAATLPAPDVQLPTHLLDNGDGRLRTLLEEMMLAPEPWSRL